MFFPMIMDSDGILRWSATNAKSITDLFGLDWPLDRCDGTISGQMLIPGVKRADNLFLLFFFILLSLFLHLLVFDVVV